MQHNGFIWKMRVAGLLALGLACVPAVTHAETDSVMRAERTSTFDVVLTIGPAQATAMQASDSMGMSMGHDASMADNTMQPQHTDQGMAVNHWLDVQVTQAGSGMVVNDLTPTIRILDKGTGEAHDLPGVMAMAGGVNASDFHYGQNVFLPDGTYEISVLLGPAETAQFRDVVVASTPMMTPGMNDTMGTSHDMSMNDMPAAHP
jgi:hypothetical protein